MERVGSLAVFVVVSLLTLTHAEIDFIAERLPLQGMKPDAGTPWPMPSLWDKSNTVMNFDPRRLTFDILQPAMKDCPLLQENLARFNKSVLMIKASVARSMSGEESEGEGEAPVPLRADVQDILGLNDTLQGHGEGQVESESQGQVESDVPVPLDDENEGDANLKTVRVLQIEVSDMNCPRYPTLEMKENYTIFVHNEIMYVQGESIWGVIRGLETLLQLFYTRNGRWKIHSVTIKDSPRFAHRGLHMDTARHFYPLKTLKKNLDAMTMNKFNVFHWHIVDAQSFPYESYTFPELSEKGAFTPRKTYSQKDVAEVIEYARVRGIRVLVEFDTPGHAHSWGKAMPELLTPCFAGGEKFKANYSQHADRENFDPTKNETFTFLERFFNEVKDVFPDAYLHLGMDEAHYMCWESSPEIAAFMQSMGFGNSYTQLEQYYNNRLLQIVQGLGKKSIIWEDPINNGAVVPNDTIVQVWKNEKDKPWPEFLADALNHGYDVILSSCWYLNYIKYGQDWKDFYNCEPTSVEVSDELRARIVGGEACVWSEYVDPTNILQNLWPRASAVAERLWSDASLTDTDQAAFRLDQHRCRMLRLGVPAQPILPGYCREDYNTDNENVTSEFYIPGSDVTTESNEINTGSSTENPEPTTKGQKEEEDDGNTANAFRTNFVLLFLALFPAFLALARFH